MSYTYHWAQVRVCQYVPVVSNYKRIAIYSQLKHKIKCDIPVNLLKPNDIYRVSQEECARLRKSVPYVKLYRYNPKHLYPKLNGYGDNGHRKVWASGVSTYCTPSVMPYSSTAHAQQ